jgi:hypothetical protein
MEKVVLRILIFDMKQFVAIYILCLLFLPLHGQKVFGYYRYPSHNGLNSQWKRVPQNDTVLSVTKQKGRLFTEYIILYHDIKMKFKIENDVVLQLDSIGVYLEKLPPPHYVTFWVFPANNYLGIGYRVPGVIHENKSIQINIFPKPEYPINCPLETSYNVLKIRKNNKRVYVYVETRGKGQYIKVSREKATRMVEDENHPQQP